MAHMFFVQLFKGCIISPDYIINVGYCHVDCKYVSLITQINNQGQYSQSFVYCRVFVLLIIDYSTKKGVLVYSRKCASEIVYFRSNPYRKQCDLIC